MFADIEKGRFSLQIIQDMTEEAMATEYGASRDTVRLARRELLSEIVEN
jgi:DNA-binding GntR family transcriptional regulator